LSAPFRVYALKRCADCGHQWEPGAPKWLLIVGGLAGPTMLALAVIFLIEEGRKNWSRALLPAMIGLAAVWGCARGFRRPSRTDARK
jgi:hypothetical protein